MNSLSIHFFAVNDIEYVTRDRVYQLLCKRDYWHILNSFTHTMFRIVDITAMLWLCKMGPCGPSEYI